VKKAQNLIIPPSRPRLTEPQIPGLPGEPSMEGLSSLPYHRARQTKPSFTATEGKVQERKLYELTE